MLHGNFLFLELSELFSAIFGEGFFVYLRI